MGWGISVKTSGNKQEKEDTETINTLLQKDMKGGLWYGHRLKTKWI